MRKLIVVFLILFSVQTYAKQMYVKQESNGDIIYSNSPIKETKPDVTPDMTAPKSPEAEAKPSVKPLPHLKEKLVSNH
jgi:hypothetical protein